MNENESTTEKKDRYIFICLKRANSSLRWRSDDQKTKKEAGSSLFGSFVIFQLVEKKAMLTVGSVSLFVTEQWRDTTCRGRDRGVIEYKNPFLIFFF